MTDILARARAKVLDEGTPLNQDELLEVLQLPDDRIDDLLSLAHEVRVKWCGEEVDVEGIVSLKTGGCPEDCRFCSQSALYDSPVKAVRLDIEGLIESAKEVQKTGATEFCIVAAVRSPNEALMEQVEDAVGRIRSEVDVNVSASLGILNQAQVDRLKKAGVHRYNHNLETARSNFPNVVTTHTWEERVHTVEMIRDAGMETCVGGILGLGETLEQRAEFASELAELNPTEVPMNFLDPRPGTPFQDLPLVPIKDALRAIGAFRLALPRTILRFAGGRELTLGDIGTEKGLLGGINAVIAGNYLTTLGRDAENDLDLLDRLHLPIKALNATV